MSDAALEVLRPLAAKIRGAEQKTVVFRPATWQPHFEKAGHPHLLGELGLGTTVDRDTLRAWSDDMASADDRRRLFVATMIWGSGTTNGRGPRYTEAALSSEALDPALAATVDLVRSNCLAEAYRAFRVSGVGPAFFTKWFWAASSSRPERRPLILDARVWKSLGALGWSSIEAAGTRRRAERYEAYVDAMHRWAAALNTNAEQLELFLFQQAGTLS